ncbi:ABC transporter ATP-binding protein/permease [Chloroflexi bacterium TSY]|nr:ABC transporter ATP-binding protein/permease [Chloroflexi bacterium TSY]
MDNQTPKRTRSDLYVLRQLLAYWRGEEQLLISILGMLILYAVSQALAPALIGRAVDQYISVGNRGGLTQTMLFLLGTYLLGYIGFMGQIRFLGTLSQRLLKRLRADIFAHVQRLSLSYFYKHGAGDLMSRLVNDTDAIGTLFSQSLMQSLGSLFGLIGVLIAMFTLNVELSLVTVLVLPIMVATTAYFSRRSRVAYRETRRALGQLSADLEEDLTNVREAQSFARTAINIEHFALDNAANRDANIYAASITAAFSPTMDVLSTLATVLVAGYGGWLAFNDQVTVGVVVAFLTYAQQFFRPVQMLSNLYTQMQSAFAASERVFELLETEPEIVDKSDAQEMPKIDGHVQFDDVVFGYDDSQVILNGVSLQAAPGETIALVGETGSGKSTVVNLIGRFYDVMAGRVLVDGYDVRDVTQASLRTQMGEVPQNSFLFADTIANNIRYGKPDASIDDIMAAATVARAHNFIMELEDGYEAKLSAEGGSLSQGQRQLLCIARAILADPQLLILDEATSNIDTRTERLVQAAIDELLQNRTAFVIAHRLSTIRHADRIIVIGDSGDDGSGIIEQGSHDELMAHGGVYASLIEAQQVSVQLTP